MKYSLRAKVPSDQLFQSDQNHYRIDDSSPIQFSMNINDKLHVSLSPDNSGPQEQNTSSPRGSALSDSSTGLTQKMSEPKINDDKYRLLSSVSTLLFLKSQTLEVLHNKQLSLAHLLQIW